MESYERAREYARVANERMQRHRIPPTPPYFTVWYTYASGRNPELKAAIDRLAEQDNGLTADSLAAVHERFFALEYGSSALVKTSEQIQNLLSSTLGLLREAQAGNSVYGNSLDAISREISDSHDIGALANIVNKLAGETKIAIERSSKVESELAESTREIDLLRQNLESARLEAMTDPLTGLANRKQFNICVTSVVSGEHGPGEPCSLLMIDIDHFKSFNDRFGHQLGDDVLKLVARVLLQNIKGQDIAVRYGGEEFAIILPNTPIQGAVKVGEDIRANLAARKLINKMTGVELGAVTVSIGAAEYDIGEASEIWIARADRGLYAAKRSGRNRVMSVPKVAATATVSG